jgi:hypothetical protein
MKTLLFLFMSLSAMAQCETERFAQSYIAIPSFFSLYFNDQCISQPLTDTTVCVKVARTTQGQVAAFSYSSPNGTPAFVTEVKQYDNTCTFIESGSLIPAGTDTVTVCYTIQANFIDNFCPYTILAGGLAVDWCGQYAYYTDNLHVRFTTCSNSGTEKYEIIQSTDGYNWRVIQTIAPKDETTSTESDYNLTMCFHNPGLNYFAIREHDLNGGVNVSDVFYCEIPYPLNPKTSNFDILGRQVQSNTFMFYVIPSK